jgi:hypothetical protein
MRKIEKFENQKRICHDIEILVISKRIDYIEAAILYAEENDYEIEYIANILAKNIVMRSKIEQEAEDLNFIKKRARLPNVYI